MHLAQGRVVNVRAEGDGQGAPAPGLNHHLVRAGTAQATGGGLGGGVEEETAAGTALDCRGQRIERMVTGVDMKYS